MIEKNTPMLLFRYNNYFKYSFIEEHKKIIEKENYVWIMKIGRPCNQSRLDNVTNNGGHIILKSPRKDGDNYYIGKYVEVINSFPDKRQCMPNYYKCMEEKGELLGLKIQCFKVIKIEKLDSKDVEKIVMLVNDRKVSEVIAETRTAVMFVYNTDIIYANF